MTVKQISVFVENKPGMLAELANALNENKINMRALSLAETKDFGIIRLILDDPFNAVRVQTISRRTIFWAGPAGRRRENCWKPAGRLILM